MKALSLFADDVFEIDSAWFALQARFDEIEREFCPLLIRKRNLRILDAEGDAMAQSLMDRFLQTCDLFRLLRLLEQFTDFAFHSLSVGEVDRGPCRQLEIDAR